MPERVDSFDELPRSAMGKLLKQEIRSRVLERARAEPG
jgi:acyl-coenzyme A synthetase/AMP-(fatty) acid ligase